MSQFSEGALSDILPDVDHFITETGILEEVGCIMAGSFGSTIGIKDEQDPKGVLVESFGTSNTVSLKYENIQYPPEQSQNFGTEEYPGDYNFEVLVIPSEQKTPWEYSSKLNKIFIGMNQTVPIAFSVKQYPVDQLYIRVTPVFSQSHHFDEIVHRCLVHQQIFDVSNKNLPQHVIQHVMRCKNELTKYFGDFRSKERLSLVLPLGKPQPGCDVIKEFFSFVCASSCVQGMNRRPIDVIFTLENDRGDLLGRRIMSVRVCACAKRDREKEEKEFDRTNIPCGKRIKLEPLDIQDDSKMYHVNFNIVGKNNFLDVLKFAQRSMAHEVLKHKNEKIYKKCYQDLSTLIDKSSNNDF